MACATILAMGDFSVVVGAGTLRSGAPDAVTFPHQWTAHGVTVDTSFTGAHLLHLAAAACVLNDVYREAGTLGVDVRGVRVSATGDSSLTAGGRPVSATAFGSTPPRHRMRSTGCSGASTPWRRFRRRSAQVRGSSVSTSGCGLAGDSRTASATSLTAGLPVSVSDRPARRTQSDGCTACRQRASRLTSTGCPGPASSPTALRRPATAIRTASAGPVISAPEP